jgi:hypothetical protein
MNLQTFLAQMPGCYDGWGRPGARPRSPAFQQVLERVRGLTAPGVLQLLNLAVGCLEPGECYGEVGSFQGATLLGALLGRPQARAWAVDDFTEFDPDGTNLATLRQNLSAFGVERQVRLYNEPFEQFFLRRPGGVPPAGVYFYDGAHDYRSQLLGLLLVRPALADRALLVIDDGNWPYVRQATWDFLAAQPEARLLLDLPTPGNGHPSFWNGLLVLAWDRTRPQPHPGPQVGLDQQPEAIASLYLLQHFHLRRQGDQVRLQPIS